MEDKKKKKQEEKKKKEAALKKVNLGTLVLHTNTPLLALIASAYCFIPFR